MTLPLTLDLAAVFVFAITGGLVASRAQLDIVGFLFLGCLTGVGGGTLRDLLLDRHPVFWLEDPSFIAVACVAALMVFVGAHRLESRFRTLQWFDALALASALAAGIAAARSVDASWPIVLIMGVITGTFGGLMRDVVANEVPMVLRQGELYLSACLAGALTAVVILHFAPGALMLSVTAGAVVTFALRAGSLAFGWRLPVYKPRPPRTEPPKPRR